MITFIGNSIVRKILASFIGIYAITYWLTASVVFTGVRASIIDAETQTLTQLAESKSERLVNTWRDGSINLKAWAALDVMNDMISGDVDKRVDRTLDGLKAQYDLSGDIYAFDSSGKLIASSTDTEHRGNFKIPSEWMPKENTFFFADKHINPFNQKQVIALVQPITASFSKDYQIGFLVLTYPWDDVERLTFGGNVNTVLIKTGPSPIPLAADIPDTSVNTILTTSLETQTASIDDESYVLGQATVSEIVPDWKIITLRKTEVALKSVRKVAWELALLGALLSLPIIAGVRWLAVKLMAPVIELTGFVSGITDSGSLDKRAHVRGRDELGVLAQSFNHMAETLEYSAKERERFVQELEALNLSLEAKVNQRTQELTTAFDELKSTQGQLVQSEKMASLGQLVAGVAHELNNPIAFIYANFPHLEEYATELLTLITELRTLHSDPETSRRADEFMEKADIDFLREDIFKIIRSGQDGASRVKEIVRSLRSFSRMDEGEFKTVRLEDGIDDTLAILNHELRGRITVEKDFKLETPVPCFSGQINQVFMNIIYNALQAMKSDGHLRISTRRADPWAIITISDTGPGIPPDIIKRIFDPFFTTKKVGEGTGLGLSISYGIIEKHQGQITVQSEVGVGTTFEIKLPLQAVDKKPNTTEAS